MGLTLPSAVMHLLRAHIILCSRHKTTACGFFFLNKSSSTSRKCCQNVAASGSHFGNQPFIQFSMSKTQEVKWLQTQSWWIRLIFISRWSSFSPLATRCYRTRQERVSSITAVLPVSSYVTYNHLCIKTLYDPIMVFSQACRCFLIRYICWI